jgi:hypothetical protein
MMDMTMLGMTTDALPWWRCLLKVGEELDGYCKDTTVYHMYAAFEIGIAHGKKHFGNKLQCCSLLREGYHTQQQIMICRQNEDDYNKIMT